MPKIAKLRLPIAAAVTAALLAGCASTRGPYETPRDKTKKGAAIGAVAGGAVGVYMDAQEEKIARIPGTTVERIDEETLLVRFESDILFDVDSATVRSDGRATLEDVGAVLREYDKTAVVVQGHTDSTGSDAHNQELSERRASSVASELRSRGVDSERIATLGMGEGYPVASNETDSGRQRNRRVEILLKANG